MSLKSLPTEPVDTKKPDTLWKACARGDVERMTAYVEAKSALNECDEYKMTLLHHAVHGKQVAVAQLLIEAGSDVDAQDGEGWSALQHAVDKGCAPIVRLLCEKGADPCTKDQFKRTLLHVAAMNGAADIIEILREEGGCSPNAKTVVGFVPLHYAAQNGHLESCKALKPSKQQLAAEAGGKTPLQLAEENGHSAVSEYLKSLA